MDIYIGTIQLFPYNFVPIYWQLCNGAILQIMQNQALYSLLETKFGGDGRTTFALPNLTGTSPVPGMEYYIAMNGIYPARS
jgi:microcystin-dependent protein